MPKVLIETTYLLPAAGIAVEGVPADSVLKIRSAGHELLASDISLFEVLAKGAKLASEGKADPERISLAIKSILADKSIEKVSAYSEETMKMAIELRGYHSDFVDCLILASAASACDIFVTEDSGIPKKDELLKAILRRKPRFRILTLRALLGR